MVDENKPPSYDNAGYAPPFTTPPYNPQFQASGVPPQQPYAGPPPNGVPYYSPQQQNGLNTGNVNVTVAGVYPPPPPPTQYVQQPQVVIVNNSVQPAAVSMGCAIALSCVAFWLFGWLFGGIAFVLAIVGQNAATAGDAQGAIRMRNASYGVSIAGIVICIIVVAVVVGVSVSTANAVAQTRYTPYCYYDYYGNYQCL